MGQQIYLKADGKTVWQQIWRELDGKKCFFRSKMEYRYALYLNLLKKQGKIAEWQHEPRTFHFTGVKNGAVSYKPDFLVIHTNGAEEWCEVKGQETGRDRTKWKRMAKFYPQHTLRVVRSDFFSSNIKALKSLIPNWE